MTGAETSMDFYFDPAMGKKSGKYPARATMQYNRSLINILAYSEEINQSAVDDASFGPGMSIVDSSDVIDTDADMLDAFGPSREPSHSIDEDSDSELEEQKGVDQN